ncbi:MAG: sigma 54-interacting transcriptional regulator [Rhodobacter sp.]|nr:sigma 54-interacting transcriptional regulator [Rhodobacter sp.]
MPRSHQEPEFSQRSQQLTFDDVDPAETSRAWSRFLANLNAPSMPVTGVRPLIYRSWMRSNTTGIRPEQFAAPSLNNPLIDEKQIFNNCEMRRATQACLHNMADLLSGAEAMLILTDRNGVILETVGDKSTLNKGGKINLSVGGVWSENASGTNGIGTALWMDKPVYVHGEEHFCEGMKAWSCAAAPIHDPVDRSIIGIINLSGLTSIFQKHNAAFAAALARDIEVSLNESQSLMNFQLLEWIVGRAPRRAHSGNDGIAIIDRFGRLIFDRSSSGNVSDRLSAQRQGKPFLDLSGGISEAAILEALPDSFVCKDIQLIELEGTVKGASLVLENVSQSTQKTTRSPRRSLPCAEVGDTGLKIVGRSDAILKALDAAHNLLRTNAPAIIQGPTGVGKELFARLIHADTVPAEVQPFAAINCAGLTREMFQSELARVKSGASDSPAPARAMNRAFLVFDEIGELHADLQPALLRALEDILESPGGLVSATPPARILSLTNRTLLDDVAAGHFRQDLYYRLGAIVLDIPPLKDRGEDILLIFEHYNQLISEETGQQMLDVGSEVEQALLAHGWPGNVRELRNTVYSIHCNAKTRRIGLSDLPFNQEGRAGRLLSPGSDPHAAKPSSSESLKDSEIALIESVLMAHHGNLSQTAKALGISRPTLYRKMNIYGICTPDDKSR